MQSIQEKVIQAVCGMEYNVILCENNHGIRILYAFGSHELGQCGVGGRIGDGSTVEYPHTIGFFHEENEIRIEKIAAGFEHTLALSADGKVCSLETFTNW